MSGTKQILSISSVHQTKLMVHPLLSPHKCSWVATFAVDTCLVGLENSDDIQEGQTQIWPDMAIKGEEDTPQLTRGTQRRDCR